MSNLKSLEIHSISSSPPLFCLQFFFNLIKLTKFEVFRFSLLREKFLPTFLRGSEVSLVGTSRKTFPQPEEIFFLSWKIGLNVFSPIIYMCFETFGSFFKYWCLLSKQTKLLFSWTLSHYYQLINNLLISTV